MRKNVLRLLALLLTMVMTLSLTACDLDIRNLDFPDWNLDFFDWDYQESNPQTQNSVEMESTQNDPVVRLYFPTKILYYGGYASYEYEENWWEKDEFVRTICMQVLPGDERITEEHLNTDGEIHGYDNSIERYENGMIVYSYYKAAENEIGLLGALTILQYDSFGRQIMRTEEMDYIDPEDDFSVTYPYEYTDATEGSLGVYHISEDSYTELYYDKNHRLIKEVSFRMGNLQSSTDFEYNSAGCTTSIKLTYAYGGGYWTKTVYDYIELPLSVAQKWPMFKWEYVE